MDLIKIGGFIALCRSERVLTQEQLAERLYVSPSTIVSWEKGICLPDADKIVEICNMFGISVSELLNGARIDMRDFNTKTDALLIQLIKKEEMDKKKLKLNAWIISIVSTILFLVIAIISLIYIKESALLIAIITIAFILLLMVLIYSFKVEIDNSYYECSECHHRFIPSDSASIFSLKPGKSLSRRLKCPKCNKKTLAKKVVNEQNVEVL